MLDPAIKLKLATLLHGHLGEAHPLSGGCVGEVYGFSASDKDYVVKVDLGGSGTLVIEGQMLDYLANNTLLPVPKPVAYENTFLLMPKLAGGSGFNHAAEIHAADLLAELHGIRHKSYGFDFDTVIGGLPQPNSYSPSWINFFAEQRLLSMAKEAYDAGNLPRKLLPSLEKLAGRLSHWLDEPNHPSLIHGDIWSGNVLAENGRITGLIDPAIYYADFEIELSFITLFSTFGQTFFRRYEEHRPLSPAFQEIKKPLYNLYPLLVHARLFGGSYVNSVAHTLSQFV